MKFVEIEHTDLSAKLDSISKKLYNCVTVLHKSGNCQLLTELMFTLENSDL